MATTKKAAPSVDDIVGQAPSENTDSKSVLKPEEIAVPSEEVSTGASSVANAVDDKKAMEDNNSEEQEKKASLVKEEPKQAVSSASDVDVQSTLASSQQDTSDASAQPMPRVFHRPPRPSNPNMISNPAALQGPTEEVKGILDVQPEGHGFLRPKFIPSNRDIYISQSQIRRFMLRAGDLVGGIARPPKDNERYYGLLKVESVNDAPAEEAMRRPWFDDLTPIYPNKQVVLGTGKSPISTRMIDLLAPIGFGQRGLIVSPPKAGKTTILKEIAAGISQNFPQAHLMAALIGERPEEVTDISMSVKGEVVASNFDEPPEHQTRVAEITLERAKRLVEMGKDVIILLDSVTRLARAYNLAVAPSGRTLSGGFDPAALWPAKKFFGAARNCQEGGSLTIIGTALVDTGSRMDDLIYEEFKGTGNMELHLDRQLAERRVFPAINVTKSGTREEARILTEEQYKHIVTLRRMLDMLSGDGTEMMIERLSKTDTNEEFFKTLGQ